MKNLLITSLFYCFIYSLSAQIKVSGKVISSENNEPLSGASVYFNNTSVGTSTNNDGEFNINIKNGTYTLIVSFLGHKTKEIKIDKHFSSGYLTISLTPDNTFLEEVQLKKTKYDNVWKHNLYKFKQAFLGRANLAKECVIENPKVLHFEFNSQTNELTAFARAPLKIKHKGLGYLIEYDLAHFSIKNNYTFYSGYSKYSHLKKRIKKKWKRNRLTAYNGSPMHFLRSLIHQNLAQEGFVVNQFKRVLNPDRPTEKQIDRARKLIRLSANSINFSKKITNPQTVLDSALVTLRKSSLPKYQDYLYKRNTPYKELLSYKNNFPFLDFENHLSIIYKNEKEELNYLIGFLGKRNKATGMQTSSISLINGKSMIDPTGILIDPNAIITEGYWSYESFANMLPLDYKPPK